MTGAEQEEKIWTWEMMEPGTAGPPMTIEITRESIANYARSVQDSNPIYFDDAAARAEGYESVVAAPTMLFVYAPYDRWEMFNSYGYLAPEQAKEPRSTPFAGVEVTYQGVPVYPGDVITSVITIDHTYVSRSDNKFVTYRIVGHNQRNEKVCDYLYNTIWEYAKGRKTRTT